MENQSIFDRFNKWARTSVTLKLISIGILILILLIPTSMLTSLIRERQNIRDQATDEVSSKWGLQQTIGGPVISVPYKETIKDENGFIEEVTRYAHFLPEQVNITGTVLPEKRYRGIYVVMLYKAQLHVSGSFSHPDFNLLNIAPGDLLPSDAFMSVGIPDLKGINESVTMKVNNLSHDFGPGIPVDDIFYSGMSFQFPLGTDSVYHFEFDISINGSTSLSFLPFGKETNVQIISPWGSPSFEGSFLPDSRSVNDSGFTAKWKVLQLNRNYPQQGTGSFIPGIKDNGDRFNPGESGAAAFGVKLLLPIDEYQKTLRSVKYCIMFIIITFLTFFFVEVLSKRRIHAIQYLLVGSAICLFYVLLLSISEHLRFSSAYLVSCLSILILVTAYVRFVFKNSMLTAVFACILAILYGFFYSLLQLEDYSLLLGSIGLFIILATIMYLTRKVDWYGNE